MLLELLFDKTVLYPIIAGLCTWLIITIAMSFIYSWKLQHTFSRYNISGPDPSLLGGNLKDFIYEGDNYDVHTKWHKQFGRVFGYSIGNVIFLHVTDLDVLRQIFFENNDVFDERADMIFEMKPMCSGILFARKARWGIMRKALTPAFNFYGSNAPNSFAHVEQSILEFQEFLDKRRLESDDKRSIKSFDIQDVMKAMALHLISSIAILLKEVKVEENNELVRGLDSFLEQADKGMVNIAAVFPFLARVLSFMSNHFEFASFLKKIHLEVDREIDEGLEYLNGKNQDDLRLSSIYKRDQPPAVIHRMIKMVHEGKMTRTELSGNVEAILIAGYDTTSTTLTYVFWTLGKHPEIQEKLRFDVMRIGTESPYLLQVLKEVMRLYVTVSTFTKRVCNRDFKIGKYTIPKGANIVYNAEVMHHDPEYWPDPYKFDPERFGPGVEIHPCAYAPFGLGERRCLGYKLALMEMKYTICSVILRYKLKTVAPEELLLKRYSAVLTKPREKVLLDLELIDPTAK